MEIEVPLRKNHRLDCLSTAKDVFSMENISKINVYHTNAMSCSENERITKRFVKKKFARKMI